MNILITGGSKGIGRETALTLASDKNNMVIVTGRDKSALEKLENETAHNNISGFIIDFSKPASNFEALKDYISSNFGNLDILINNAGSLVNKRFTELGESEIRDMMEINYFAPSILISSLFPFFRRGSHIVNISSMGGFQGSTKFAGLSCYSASKAAIACLTECLAAEFSEYGISVNCLAPGSVSTEMLSEAFPGYKAPVSAKEMGSFIAWFATSGGKLFNGRIIPVALTTP